MDVSVLGATGLVGQRFVQLLDNHPIFELKDLAASSRSAGKSYEKATKWFLGGEMPRGIRDRVVREIDPGKIKGEIVFSALPADIAREVEPRFAEEGFIVASNASAYRMVEDIPLIIPEVNPEHLEMIEVQKERRGWDGCIITNPNCTTIVALISLKPIFDKFGLEEVLITTMQAVSGAGYRGVTSMGIIDNIIPFIKGEEEKVEAEILKLLGSFDGEKVAYPDLTISASCNRVPVLDGHLESVFIKTRKKGSVEDIKKAMRDFKALPQKLKLPSAPKNPIIVREEEDRPQPRLDRLREKGMAVTVGRVRPDPIMDFKYSVIGHNTIRGAAGASILNAELLVEKGI